MITNERLREIANDAAEGDYLDAMRIARELLVARERIQDLMRGHQEATSGCYERIRELEAEQLVAHSVIKRLLIDTRDIEPEQVDQGSHRIEICFGGSVYEIQLNLGEVSVRRIGGTEVGRG